MIVFVMTNKLIYSPSDITRFESYIDRSGGPEACHLWTGCLTHSGYGRLQVAGKARRANKIALELKLGRPLKPNNGALHDCPGGDNPACCNPKHLFEGTQKDNVRDSIEKDRWAYGDKNGSRTHPDCHNGELNGAAKVTAIQVRAMRSLYVQGGVTKVDVGRQFNLSKAQATKILNRQTWTHV